MTSRRGLVYETARAIKRYIYAATAADPVA